MNEIYNKLKIKINMKLIYKCTILIAFIGTFILTYNCFLTPDEYNYSNITWTNHRLSNIKDILVSQKILYFQWTGRIIVQFLTQYFLFIGKPVFDILNAIIYVGFAILIGIFFSKNKILGNTTIALFLMMFCIPVYSEKFLWLAGSINYLWTSFALVVLCKYLYELIIKNKKFTKFDTIILYIFSFLAGWSHENVAFLAGSFIFVMCIVNFRKIFRYEKKDLIRIIISILIFGVGAALLIFAPGNFQRMGDSGINIKTNIKGLIQNFKVTYILIIILCSTSSVLLILKKFKEFFNMCLYIMLPAFISLTPILLIGVIPDRAMLAFETFMMISIIYSLNTIFEKINMKKIEIGIMIIISTILIYQSFIVSWSILKYIVPYSHNLKQNIEYYKNENKKIFVYNKFELPKILDKKYVVNQTPFELKDSIPNTYFSKFYEFDETYFVKKNHILFNIVILDEQYFDDKIKAYIKEDNINYSNKMINRISEYYMNTNKNMRNDLLFEMPYNLITDVKILVGKDKNIKIKYIEIIGENIYKKIESQDLLKFINKNSSRIELLDDKTVKVYPNYDYIEIVSDIFNL